MPEAVPWILFEIFRHQEEGRTKKCYSYQPTLSEADVCKQTFLLPNAKPCTTTFQIRQLVPIILEAHIAHLLIRQSCPKGDYKLELLPSTNGLPPMGLHFFLSLWFAGLVANAAL